MTLINSAVLQPSHFMSSEVVFSDVTLPNAGLKVCVIVPARNEADHIASTLKALYEQVDDNGSPIPKKSYEVLLLVNNCTDNSAEVAKNFQTAHPSFCLHIDEINLPKSVANIGKVRRLLMDEAFRRLRLTESADGIIASTDGDTIVDANWVWQIIQEIRNGVDAVGGRILTRSNGSPVRLWHLRDVMYRSLLAKAEALIDPCDHDPWPRHFQYFGANLAVTCAAYERAGRLPEVPFLEDHAFFQALNNIDARIRKSCLVKVYTSDRQEGRVEVGFSEQLRTWNEQKKQSRLQMVESVEAQLVKFRCRKLLRKSWQHYRETGRLNKPVLLKVARQFNCNIDLLVQQVVTQNYFGKLWQQVEAQLAPNWHQQWPAVAIGDAINHLRTFVQHF